MCLRAAVPKDSSCVFQAIERSKQGIWKRFPERPHLVLRVSVPKGDGGTKARAVIHRGGRVAWRGLLKV